MKVNSKGFLAVGAVALSLMLAAPIVNAQWASKTRDNPAAGARGREMMMMMFRPGMFLRGLNLTPEQRTGVQKIFSADRTQIDVVVTANIEARKALNDAVYNGANKATLTDLAQGVSKAQLDAVLLRSSLWERIKPILTQVQLTQLQQRHDRMDQRVQNFLNRLDKKAGA